MQTVAFTVSAPVAVRATVASKAAPASAARSVSCRAALPKGFAAGLTATATALVSSPAWALVDDRLNGDGAGIPFGVNEPVLGAHLLGVATTIWALYYIAQSTDSKIISGGKTEDDGLSL